MRITNHDGQLLHQKGHLTEPPRMSTGPRFDQKLFRDPAHLLTERPRLSSHPTRAPMLHHQFGLVWESQNYLTSYSVWTLCSYICFC